MDFASSLRIAAIFWELIVLMLRLRRSEISTRLLISTQK
ncbi:hypothetical protein P353_09685 [Comamonas testosteroni]|uniref:Uncharacterized protein n=1 Tax=Comamonas testosteroni TaxID=285 RepID=A0A096FKW0_COMTE|nr:hypothetical protein P353_09685 [Comamonas testosteroni]